jgi:hypothetical protein
LGISSFGLKVEDPGLGFRLEGKCVPVPTQRSWMGTHTSLHRQRTPEKSDCPRFEMMAIKTNTWRVRVEGSGVGV